jgi:hypothetical protein
MYAARRDKMLRLNIAGSCDLGEVNPPIVALVYLCLLDSITLSGNLGGCGEHTHKEIQALKAAWSGGWSTVVGSPVRYIHIHRSGPTLTLQNRALLLVEIKVSTTSVNRINNSFNQGLCGHPSAWK